MSYAEGDLRRRIRFAISQTYDVVGLTYDVVGLPTMF